MTQTDNQTGERIAAVAERAYVELATSFPVCCVSDEFYFFPQAVVPDRDWHVWDDFSPEKVSACTSSLRQWEEELAVLAGSARDDADRIDAELVEETLRLLREQLGEIALHRTQPSFHLTVAAAGLSEALASGNPVAWQGRIAGLPPFLDRAVACLDRVPDLFRRLGLEMLDDLRAWLQQLRSSGFVTGRALDSLNEFGGFLQGLRAAGSHRLPEDQFERLVEDHLKCGLNLDGIHAVLEQELGEMQTLLRAEAARLAPGTDWVDVEQLVPFFAVRGEQLLQLYREELSRTSGHCRDVGLLLSPPAEEMLTLANVPQYLSAIRAADAYSAAPGHPPRGGTFFVMEQGHGRDSRFGRSLEYRMTAAHEAWPGHHLLDLARWNLSRPLRRPIESPLFYEGWACFAEELMALTGYFSDSWDRFLLAKRRIERAARGLVDIGLQSGRMQFAEALAKLVEVGYDRERAAAILPRYLLRPGYQVCYTFGLKQMLGLFDSFGRNDIGGFSRAVLEQGEIGFARLGKVLSSAVEPSGK